MIETQQTTTSTDHRSRQRLARAASLVLAALLLLAGCGSSYSDSATSGDSGTETTFTADRGRPASSSDDAESAMATDDEEDAIEAEGDVETDAAAGTEAGEAAVASGGFFADEPAEELDRTANNVFDDSGIRQFVPTEVDPLSTFALDVDTASYSIGRTWADNGQTPPVESVRVEEYVNAFDYDYPTPASGLTVVADGGPSPFDDKTVMLRLGVQAEEVSDADRPDAALTFVVDTSGSMDREDRLGLVKSALIGLVDKLDRDDTVAIVTYSDGADVLLEPTSMRDADLVVEAIERLRPNGSTNLEAGLEQGYALANDGFVPGGINRVILASDGVANVGLTDPDGLVELIRDDADEGIQLITVGVGMGNFDDVVMETLADDGDGFYAYVDTDAEAERLFTKDLVSSLLTVAIDAKIQVDFDADVVEEYRLIGYENRAVLDDDFRNDSVDAGELNSGHSVTALYELRLRDATALDGRDRLGTASLRWEDPTSNSVVETRLEITGAQIESRWTATPDDYRLAVTVAAFAESLRESPFADEIDLDEVLAEADALTNSRLLDRDQIEGFVDFVSRARSLR